MHASPRLLSLLNCLFYCDAAPGTKARAQRRLRPQAAMAEAKATSSGNRASPYNESRTPSRRVCTGSSMLTCLEDFATLTARAPRRRPAEPRQPWSSSMLSVFCKELESASGPQHNIQTDPCGYCRRKRCRRKLWKKIPRRAACSQEVCVRMPDIWLKKAALNNKATLSGEK